MLAHEPDTAPIRIYNIIEREGVRGGNFLKFIQQRD